ncbi:MAG: hypothetical protein RR253_02920 [Oscillospiraceae bacterium]
MANKKTPEGAFLIYILTVRLVVQVWRSDFVKISRPKFATHLHR